MKQIILIAAMDEARGIGVNNTLPWSLPEDLAHFKKATSGHPVIMGRKTFDSIGRPLPGRQNIVISRNPDWRHDNVQTAASLEEALRLATDDRIFVIGGATIFEAAMPLASELIITEIGRRFECDTFFPHISAGQWKAVGREEHRSRVDNLPYAFITYQRHV